MSGNAAKPFALRNCGPRGMRVTTLGLGGAPMGHGPTGADGDESAARTLETAYELGLRHVDTSPAYGESERRVGITLRRNEYESLSVSTKVGTHPHRRGSYAGEDIRWSLNQSLSTLGRESVDLALIHDPPSMEVVLRPGDGLYALRELREDGKCHNIGLGVQNHEFHRQAIGSGLVDVMLTYGDYNIVRRTGVPLMRFAREHGVGILLGSPQMHGFLATGEAPIEVVRQRPRLLAWYTQSDVAVAQEWFEWCREREVSMRHLNMRFVMGSGLPDCVLTGCRTPQEVAINVHEATTAVPEDVWKDAVHRIEELDAQKE